MESHTFRNSFRRATALVAALGLALSSVATWSASVPEPPSVRASITGGIVPCSVLSSWDGRYAAGTVTVLNGQVKWASTKSGNTAELLPTTVVAREHMVTNATYWFELEPGTYVLKASDAQYTTITLRAGDNVRVDIPNPCI